jgi:Arylsulfotransferase (ASST)
MLLTPWFACQGAPPQGLPGADGGAQTDGGTDAGTDTGTASDAIVANATLTVDPDVTTMLVLSWDQNVAVDAVWLRFTDAEGEWRESPRRSGEGGARSEVVLGLPQDTDTTVSLMTLHGDSEEVQLTLKGRTGSLPEPRLQPLLTAEQPTSQSPEAFVLGTVEINDGDYYAGPFWVYIVDRQGRIVWYAAMDDKSWTLFPRVARDGSHILFEHARVLALGTSIIPSVERRTLDGVWSQDIETIGLGFTFEELPDGTLLFDDYAAWPDLALSSQAPDGTRTELWNCTEWMGDRCEVTYCCAPNAIVWQPDQETVLWSMWNSDAVVEVDIKTGTVLAEWGQVEGAWAFDPPDATFEKQHWPNYTSDGTLMISTHTADESEQRFREYEVDAENQVLRQVWSYGEGEDLYAIHHGEVVRLPNGNRLLNYGTDGVIRELGPDDSIVWELTWTSPYMLGHNVLLDDLYALNEGWPDR